MVFPQTDQTSMLIPLALCVLTILTHIVCTRLFRPSPQLTHIALTLMGTGALVGIGLGFSFSLAAVTYQLIVYSCLMYGHFHFFNMSDTARRIRLLLLIFTQQENSLTNIVQNYSPRTMILARLPRLEGLYQIQQRNGRYYPHWNTLRLLDLMITVWKRWVYLKQE